jgi:lipopolysaccharide transport system ATP-binding protein
MSSELAVRSRGLSKAYPICRRPSDRLKLTLTRGRWGEAVQFWAVRNVDLEIRRGETVGIVGRNGSGKSTLLEMISGTLHPSEGEVEVNGRVAALLELGAGFNPEFSGRENVHLNGAILGLAPQEIDERFDAIVSFADIGAFVDQPVKTYSSGMYARLAFAVAIHSVPDILISDEILSVGDEAFQRKCFARIEELKAGGGTILLVSHTAATILEICDRAILLESGEHLLTGSPKTVVSLYQKLLYAPNDQVEAVRDEIRREARTPGSLEAEPCAASPGAEPVADPAYFDPLLESKSALRYDVDGAELLEPMLLTRSGAPVNCLSRGERYVFRYTVRFEKDCVDVRFHTLLKTVTGLELGGGTHPGIGVAAQEMAAGSAVRVEFEFDAALNAGVYFLNCGVTGSGGRQLHRIVDAIAFRMLPVDAASTFGHVSFGHRATVIDEAGTEA